MLGVLPARLLTIVEWTEDQCRISNLETVLGTIDTHRKILIEFEVGYNVDGRVWLNFKPTIESVSL